MAENSAYSQKFYLDIIKKCAPQCFFISKMIVGDDDKAQKIFEEVFARAFKNPEIISGDTEVWFKNAVSTSACLSLRKSDPDVFSKKTRFTLGKVEVKEDYHYTFDETATLFLDLLKSLPHTLSTTVILKYGCDMTFSQIEKLLSCPISTTQNRLEIFDKAVLGLKKTADDCDSVISEIDIIKIMQYLFKSQKLPLDIDLNKYIPENLAPVETQEVVDIASFTLTKKTIIIGAATLAVVLTAIIILWSSCSNKPEKTTSVTTISSESGLSAEDFVPIEVPKPLYLFKTREYYTENNDKSKTEEYTYINGNMASSRVTTSVFSEYLTYRWSNQNKVCTLSNDVGEDTKTIYYDQNGNQTKVVEKKNKTTEYKWTYKLYSNGLIKEATCKTKSTVIHKYVYDDLYRVSKLTVIADGSTYVTNYVYDENNMVTKETLLDWDDSTLTKTYTYNYLEHTYTCEYSDKKSEKGTLSKVG